MANIQSGYLKTKNGVQLMTAECPIVHYLRFNQWSDNSFPTRYLIAKLPPTSDANGCTLHITMCTGSYMGNGKMNCDITIGNRNGFNVTGIYYGNNQLGNIRLVAYKQTNGEHWIYLERNDKYVGETFLTVESAKNYYVGSQTPKTPSGTLEKTIDSFVLFRNDRSMFPVGAVYITATNINPGTFLGGTWIGFGGGRCLVGVNSSEIEFNTPLKTGGSKSSSHKHTYGIKYAAYYSSLYDSDAGLIRLYNGDTGGFEQGWATGETWNVTGNNGVEQRRGSAFSASVIQNTKKPMKK